MPTIRAITVDNVEAHGHDDSSLVRSHSGEYADVKGSPFANEGSRQFMLQEPTNLV